MQITEKDFKGIIDNIYKEETPFKKIYDDLFPEGSDYNDSFTAFCHLIVNNFKHLNNICPGCLMNYAAITFTLGFIMGQNNIQKELFECELQIKKDKESH